MIGHSYTIRKDKHFTLFVSGLLILFVHQTSNDCISFLVHVCVQSVFPANQEPVALLALMYSMFLFKPEKETICLLFAIMFKIFKKYVQNGWTRTILPAALKMSENPRHGTRCHYIWFHCNGQYTECFIQCFICVCVVFYSATRDQHNYQLFLFVNPDIYAG